MTAHSQNITLGLFVIDCTLIVGDYCYPVEYNQDSTSLHLMTLVEIHELPVATFNVFMLRDYHYKRITRVTEGVTR